jgi:DNA mismatch repair protein MutL
VPGLFSPQEEPPDERPPERASEPRPAYASQPRNPSRNALSARESERAAAFVPSALEERSRVLAQFQALYVLTEEGGDLVVVDQHAASERVEYERLKKALREEKQPAVQALLIPILWNVSLSQAGLLKGRLETLRRLGFLVEEFGEKTFRVTEAPAAVPEGRLQAALNEILAGLEKPGTDPLPLDERILITTACHAAVRAGDLLSSQELAEILKQLSTCENPHTCPHGRPTSLRISRTELDRKFGRT